MHYIDRFTDWFGDLDRRTQIVVATTIGVVAAGGAVPTEGVTTSIVGAILLLDFFTDDVLGMHD